MRSRKQPAPPAIPTITKEEQAAEAARLLAEETAKNDRVFAGFPSAQAQAKGPPELSAPMQRIVERTFLRDEELDAAHRALTAPMALGEGRADYGSVVRALDEAEDNARLAFRLMVTAKIERERFELENGPVVATMRQEATAVLQLEKDRKERNKAITDADVVDKAFVLFGDEWQSIHHEQRRLELTIRTMEHEVENRASRCKTLQVLAGKLR